MILGRLTYCIFLIHIPILKIILGITRQPNYVTLFTINVLSVSVIIFSIIVSLMLVLFVEMPCSSLVNLMFLPKKSSLEIKTTTKFNISKQKIEEVKDSTKGANDSEKVKLC